MPMSGSNYVAPTWVDNAPPAISASELQAMCNTIQENQGNLDDIIPLVNTISGKAQAQLVSYVGTGTYGASNPCSVNTNFPIKAVFLVGILHNGDWMNLASNSSTVDKVCPNTLTTSFSDGQGFQNGNFGTYYAKTSSSYNSVTWYNTYDPGAQLNSSGYTYYFLCIG